MKKDLTVCPVKRAGADGFTLLEILVVVLIITILATIVGVNVANRPEEARIAAARAQIASLKTALRLYHMDNGMLPAPRQGLDALCTPPESEPRPRAYREGGYLDSRRVPDDPWGRPYSYLVPGREGEPFEIISYGSDGEPGGEGAARDISSSDL
ncbi:MAG: type II secretion system major pseudopilin GspG [Lentisphaerae bacterium]|nr:type II secretion system major pseudopilin GspG [Lentisphaerota bacterium]